MNMKKRLARILTLALVSSLTGVSTVVFAVQISSGKATLQDLLTVGSAVKGCADNNGTEDACGQAECKKAIPGDPNYDSSYSKVCKWYTGTALATLTKTGEVAISMNLAGDGGCGCQKKAKTETSSNATNGDQQQM